MAKLPFTDKTNLWEASARLTLRFPWLIVLLFFVLCAASLRYTVQHFGIKNNIADLLSQDLPFQKVRLKLEQAFPEDAAAIIVVAESETPEYTTLAAEQVQQRLQSRPQHFTSAHIPDDNPFFRQQGFLYLDLDDLEDLSDKLIDAQPFIGHLGQNYHVTGLFDIIARALAAEENAASIPLDPLLGAIDQDVVKVKSEQAHYLSWQQLLTEDSFNRDQTRRLIIAKPHLDFNELMPAQKPMAYLRGLASELTLHYPGVSHSLTGEVALEHEEMETVNQGMVVSSIVSLLLVCTMLWLGLRSFRLLFAAFVALIVLLLLLMTRSLKSTLLVIAPLLIAALLTGACNMLLHNPFNFANIIVLPLLLGMGVDSGIHMMHRLQHPQSDTTGLLKTSTARGVFFSALTTLCSFSSLTFNTHQGTASMGLLLAIGITLTIVCTLLVLPALSYRK